MLLLFPTVAVGNDLAEDQLRSGELGPPERTRKNGSLEGDLVAHASVTGGGDAIF